MYLRLSRDAIPQPRDSDWTQIYLYIAGRSYKRWNKGEMPADIAVDSISDYQMGELNRLKSWLYHQRELARNGHIYIVGNRKTEKGARQWEAENGW